MKSFSTNRLLENVVNGATMPPVAGSNVDVECGCHSVRLSRMPFHFDDVMRFHFRKGNMWHPVVCIEGVVCERVCVCVYSVFINYPAAKLLSTSHQFPTQLTLQHLMQMTR